ncbi:hypothetical protein [Streptomyces melanogenes]|uniref:hypothetical protein n=1 Tax=Streptomyces melanogenes TaxID=67326 RepID=UPI00167DE49D|nr:hypothetical protein [Streptomyces melanogenes]GGP44626.1 hypothetical protein GCM10010278_21610 [Streptomyces melanogenes]
MLRIVDHLVGRGPLRICAHVPEADGPGDLTGLRVLLTGDVLARVVELRGRAVLTGRTGPRVPGVAATGIHPADAEGTPEELADALGGPPALQLSGRAYEGGGGAFVQIAEARASGSADLEGDALAVRLLLLDRPYHEPVTVTAEDVEGAERLLAQWRSAVAGWAEEPSKPLVAELERTARAGLEDSLDTAAVLRLLRGLAADADVPAGAKFETFARLDRVLGLELTREIGKAPAAGARA